MMAEVPYDSRSPPRPATSARTMATPLSTARLVSRFRVSVMRSSFARPCGTLVQIDRHSTQLEELDVEGILAFAERVLPKSSDLWVHVSLDQRQRLQQLFFPEGVPFDGKRFSRTAVNAAAFSYLRSIPQGD